eukprot:4426458-Pleurochrysis_carterae.AAC.5
MSAFLDKNTDSVNAMFQNGGDCHAVLTNYRRAGGPWQNVLSIATMKDSSGALRFSFGMLGQLSKDLGYEPEIREERCDRQVMKTQTNSLLTQDVSVASNIGSYFGPTFPNYFHAASELPFAEPPSSASGRHVFGAAVGRHRRSRGGDRRSRREGQESADHLKGAAQRLRQQVQAAAHQANSSELDHRLVTRVLPTEQLAGSDPLVRLLLEASAFDVLRQGV